MISYRDKLSRITFILLLASVLMIIVTGCSAGGIKVSFDTDGGSPIRDISIDSSMESVPRPNDPVKEGFYFDNWYTDAERTQVFDFSVVPDRSITLYAKWLPRELTVTFRAKLPNESSYSYIYRTIIYGQPLTPHIPSVPERTGYIGSWDLDNVPLDRVTQDLVIDAVYTQKPFTMTFIIDDQTPPIVVTEFGGQPYQKPDNPERHNFIFGGWFTDPEFTSPYVFPNVMPSADITLYAWWVRESEIGELFVYETADYAGGTDNAIRITGLTRVAQYQTNMLIPEEIEGLPVKYIGYDTPYSQLTTPQEKDRHMVFKSEYLNTVHISDTIEYIGSMAFSGAPSFTSITFMDNPSLKKICDAAFMNCHSLNGLYIPQSVEYIGDLAFAAIDLPANVEMSLSYVLMPIGSRLSHLGDAVFKGTRYLTSFTVPASLEEVNYKMFEDSSLEEFAVEDGHPHYVETDGVIFSDHGTTLICFPNKKATTYSVPLITTKIGVNAFRNNSMLTRITLSGATNEIQAYGMYNMPNLMTIDFIGYSQLTYINEYAFAGCVSLTSWSFPEMLLSIGDYAFSGINGRPMALRNISFGNRLEAIGDYAFNDCTLLSSARIPSSVITIGEGAFKNCRQMLLEIDVDGSRLTEIGDYAFYGCYNTRTVYLPSSLISLGDYAFSAPEDESLFMQLTTVAVVSDISGVRRLERIGKGAFKNCIYLEQFQVPERVSDIGEEAFYNCRSLRVTIVALNNVLREIKPYTFYGCINLTNIIIPSTVIKIGDYAFYGCIYLATVSSGTQVSDSDISIIGESAFEGCIRLTSHESDTSKQVLFPNTTIVGRRAFFGCSQLDNVVIPRHVTTIEEEAFAECVLLRVINTAAATLTVLKSNVFRGCSKLTNFVLPDSVTTFEGHPFTNCQSLVFFTVSADNPNFTAVQSEQGNYNVLYTKSSPKTIALFPTGIQTAFAVAQDVEAIAPHAFNSSRITRLTFAPSETQISIGDYAFAQCNYLTEVVISPRVKQIGNFAFYNNAILRQIALQPDTDNENALTIGDYAFSAVPAAEITIPERVSLIGVGAFEKCYSLTNIVFEQASEIELPLNIEGHAFAECSALAQIELPARLAYLGDYAFSLCVSLQNIDFTQSSLPLELGSYVFDNCHFVYEITIPSRLVSMGENVFYYNTSLEKAVFEELDGTVYNPEGVSLGQGAFIGCNELRQVTIPAHFTLIGDYAFYGCKNIFNIDFTDGDMDLTIGKYAFSACSSIDSFVIPARTVFIDSHAFYNSSLGSAALKMNDGGNEVIAYRKDLVFEDSQKELILGQSCFENTNLSNVVIPKRVTEIGAYAFSNNPNLVLISFEEGALCSVIMEGAFSNIGSAEIADSGMEFGALVGYDYFAYNEDRRVELPLNVETIGDYAFKDTSSYTDIILNEGLLTIGQGAFYGCKGITFMRIPYTVTLIDDMAFYGCSSLQNVEITSDDEYTLGSYVFADCAGLTSLSLKMVSLIGDAPAYGCNNLSMLNVDINNPYYRTINDVLYTGNVDYGDGKVYSEDEMLILYPAGKQGSTYAISHKTRELGPRAFSGNKYLTGLNLNEAGTTIVRIYDNTFENTSPNLEFFVSSSMDFIYKQNPLWRGHAANIKSFSLSVENFIIEVLPGDPNSCRIVKYIGLADIGSNLAIPVTLRGLKVKEIAPNAFSYNSILQIITLPQGITKISDYAFYNCSALTTINISDSVQEIGEYAFYECKALRNVNFGSNSLLTSIGNYAFQLCVSLETISLPRRLRHIGMFAFAGLENNMMNLRNAVFPADSILETVSAYAFQHNQAMNTIEFPKSLKLLGARAFNNCQSLVSIILNRGADDLAITELQNDYTFAGTREELMIYVPQQAMKEYLKARYWRNITSKINSKDSLHSSYSIELINYNYNAVRVVEYLGLPLPDNKYDKSYVNDFNALETVLKLPVVTINEENKTFSHRINQSTKITDYKSYAALSAETVTVYDAFDRLHTVRIERITFVIEGVRLNKYLGDQQDISIPAVIADKPVLEIGEYCFNYKIRNVIVPEGVLSINRNAFRYCVNLNSVQLPLSLISIGNSAFYGTAVKNVSIGAELTINASRLITIGDYAFYKCVNLTSFKAPQNTDIIGNYAFSSELPHRMKLNNVEFLGVDMTSIGINAFALTDIVTVTLPNRLKTIHKGAFKNCRYLLAIYIDDDTPTSSIINLAADAQDLLEGCDYAKIYVRDYKLNYYRSSSSSWNSLVSKIFSLDMIFDGFAISVIDPDAKTAELVHYVGDEINVIVPSHINGHKIVSILPNVFNYAVKTVTVPNTVNTISANAFYKSGVEEVMFEAGSTLESIGQNAFRYTPLKSITIPISVRNIASFAFADTMLSSITFEGEDILEIEGEPVGDLVLSSNAFSNNIELIEITLPKRLRSIGDYAFHNNINLRDIALPEDGNLNIIYNYAFSHCHSLKEITIPFTVLQLMTGVFNYCTGLETVYVMRGDDGVRTSDGLTTAGPGLFNNINNSFLKIFVPRNSLTEYKNNLANWKSYGGYSESGIYNPVIYPDYILPHQFHGDFAYSILSSNSIHLTQYRGAQTDIIIPGSIEIGGINYEVRSIGRFFGNPNLKSVTMLEGYRQTISLFAFSDCVSLEKVVLPSSVETIEGYAFNNCVSLRSINLPENIKTIPTAVFQNCRSLKSIDLPSTVIAIEEAAFINCSSLLRLRLNTPGVIEGGNSMLMNTNPHLKIFVESQYLINYRQKTIWSVFANQIITHNTIFGNFAVESMPNNRVRILQYIGNVDILYIPQYIQGREVAEISVNAIIPEIGLILLPEGSEISYGEDIADKINYYEI